MLVHKKLVPKYGIAGAVIMYIWIVIVSILSMTMYVSKITQQIMYIVPIFIIASFFYFERTAWRTVVVFLAQAMLIIPELLVESILYFAYNQDPFIILRQYPLYVFVIVFLIHLNYHFLSDFLSQIHSRNVMHEGKIAMITVLSVIVIALTPLTYFFENLNDFVIGMSFFLGIVLDIILLNFIFEFTRYQQMEKIQTLVENSKELKDDDLYALRHDIANYTNALKILQKQKEGEEA